MTIKETLFDVDDARPPHTVSLTSQSRDYPPVGPSRPMRLATTVSDAEAAGDTSAVSCRGTMPPHEPNAAESAGPVENTGAPSNEVDVVEEDAETRASRMGDCIWWLSSSHPISNFFEVATMVVILISIFAFVLETIPRYRFDANGEERTDSHPTFAVIEFFCIGWFTVEYLMRLYAAKGWRQKWLRQPLNIIDLVAILPFYISLGLSSGAVGSAFVIVRILRLVRVSRLFKFSRHSQALRVRHDACCDAIGWELGQLWGWR